LRFIRPLLFVGSGLAPAGTGSTPKRPWLRLPVADGVTVARAAGAAELDEDVTGWDVVDADLAAEHPASKTAATSKTT
jgi:hypothetical protein